MTSNVNLIAFGTFGSPNGFRQSFFSGNKEIEKSIRTFDLNSNAIKVVSNSKLYSIRKEINNHIKGISYSLYTYAKEQNSERGGTFIGSSLLFTNEICKEGLTVSILNDFHDKILVKNVHDNIIIVNHSDKLSVSKPKDFDKIEFDLRPIEFLDSTFNQNNYLVVYTELKIEKLQVLFNKALTLLGNYSTIYFTDNNEIAEFVYQKGLYKLLKVDGFDQEIANIEYEKQQKILK